MVSPASEPSEKSAASIVSAILGMRVKCVDGPGAPLQSPDFEILSPEGAIPLEVTRSTDGELLKYYHRVSKLPWEDTRLRWSWHIARDFGAAPDVKQLRSELLTVLIGLEVEGITEVDTDQRDPDGAASPWARLAQFGIRRGRSYELAGPSRIFLGGSDAFSTSPECINDLAVVELANNSSKVGDGGQLFIWVESLSHVAHLGMQLGTLPKGRPDIPDGVGVWVARQAHREDCRPDRLWRLPPNGGWQRESPPSDG